jgi:transposase
MLTGRGTSSWTVRTYSGGTRRRPCCSKCKQFRAVAPRYDKRELIYQGTVDVASIRSWLRDRVP